MTYQTPEMELVEVSSSDILTESIGILLPIDPAREEEEAL